MKFAMETAGYGASYFEETDSVSDILPKLRRITRTVADSLSTPKFTRKRGDFTPDAAGAAAFNAARFAHEDRLHDVDNLTIFGVTAEKRKRAIAQAKHIARRSRDKAVAIAGGTKEATIGLFGKWYRPGYMLIGLATLFAAYAGQVNATGDAFVARTRAQFAASAHLQRTRAELADRASGDYIMTSGGVRAETAPAVLVSSGEDK